MWKEVGSCVSPLFFSAEINSGNKSCITGFIQYSRVQKYEPLVKSWTSRQRLWWDNGAAGGGGRWCHYLLFGHGSEDVSLDTVQDCFHKTESFGALKFKAGVSRPKNKSHERMCGIMAASSVYYCLLSQLIRGLLCQWIPFPDDLSSDSTFSGCGQSTYYSNWKTLWCGNQ